MTLEAELGLEADDDDSPLRDKSDKLNGGGALKKQVAGRKISGGVQPRATMKERGKTKALPAGVSRVTAGSTEKENTIVKKAKSNGGAVVAAGARVKGRVTPPSEHGEPQKPLRSTAAAAKPTAVAKTVPAVKGGARRVPIGSAEAGAVPGWRG